MKLKSILILVFAMAFASMPVMASECLPQVEPKPPVLKSWKVYQDGSVSVSDPRDVDKLWKYITQLRSGYRKRSGTPEIKPAN